jgi:hypothetical protein
MWTEGRRTLPHERALRGAGSGTWAVIAAALVGWPIGILVPSGWRSPRVSNCPTPSAGAT